MGDNLKLDTLNICPVNIMNLRLVIIWASLYAVLWTIVTVSLDPAVPYDAVEALNWAQNGEWGSPKNPWLVGLVMRPALLYIIYLRIFTGMLRIFSPSL